MAGMKILYAAANYYNSKIQLARFMATASPQHEIKIAAYKKSSPQNLNIDWTLDALLNIYKPDQYCLDNDNLSIYFEQIKSFAPDLIITDLEYFTSLLGFELNIPVWQCSSSLINFALVRKYGLGLHKKFAHLVSRTTLVSQRNINIIDNSDRNFVYSHYGDTENPPPLKLNFNWARPYHQKAKNYIPCQHSMMAALSVNDKKLINLLKRQDDSVVFTQSPSERYDNPSMKDIGIEEEYYCNLKNSPIFICQGQMSFLADAFYNSKYSLIFPDYTDAEAITSSQISENLKLGKIISYNDKLEAVPEVIPTYSQGVKYLHEYLKEI